jgi:iron(III) transport system ATP-binding protein
MAELRCEQLSASYGSRTVLDGLDLVVPEGTLTAVLGSSGSGKTTLLRAIMGFVPVAAGRVRVGRTVVAEGGNTHLPPEKRGVGYVAQEGALYPHLRVDQNVAFGLPRAERRGSRRVDEVLGLVGLDAGYGRRPIQELSGGEQRRVSLARALAPRPRLVLLDEPFSGLDASLRAETRDSVLRALAGEGTTAVLVTHDQAEALSTGREVAVLRDGRLVQTVSPAELYRRPVDPDVARFVGRAVLLPGRISGGWAQCDLGRLPLLDATADGPAEILVRPEQIELRPSRRGTALSPATGPGCPARVTGSTFYGADALVDLVLDGSGTAVSAQCRSHDLPETGATVEVGVSGPVVGYPIRHPAPDPGP